MARRPGRTFLGILNGALKAVLNALALSAAAAMAVVYYLDRDTQDGFRHFWSEMGIGVVAVHAVFLFTTLVVLSRTRFLGAWLLPPLAAVQVLTAGAAREPAGTGALSEQMTAAGMAFEALGWALLLGLAVLAPVGLFRAHRARWGTIGLIVLGSATFAAAYVGLVWASGDNDRFKAPPPPAPGVFARHLA